MRDLDSFDTTLFGAWPQTAAYDPGGGSGWSAEHCRLAVETVFLETKSGDPQQQLRALLNDMTAEMRAQFDLFKRLRTAAEAVSQGDDEAAARLARADIKAAVDAMSLIIRTLEKIDALQRQIVRDQELESERNADETGYEAAKARLLVIIEQRVNDRVEAILAGRGRDGAENTDATGPPGADGLGGGVNAVAGDRGG
ncbi:MAG: hypothetical protein PW844_07410 [Pantoea sp.]|uniref:hypothetical protein n=1 Tax=Pantoea sp. TaxID=69393 RepID=UPI002390C909|nr:hypothetical protein [Pantoea sp.]MDE1186288.1 hypothetical protein [Pantoea sp.]